MSDEMPGRLLERLAEMLDVDNDALREQGRELRDAYLAHLDGDVREGDAEDVDGGGEAP